MGVMGRQKSIVINTSPRQSNEEEGDSSRDFGGKGEVWSRKVEMPTFDGSDPDGWVSRDERFFKLNQMSEMEKMDLVIVNMEEER